MGSVLSTNNPGVVSAVGFLPFLDWANTLSFPVFILYLPFIYHVFPLYVPCISTVFPCISLHYPCISRVFPLYVPCISTSFPLYFPCISPVFPLYFHCIYLCSGVFVLPRSLDQANSLSVAALKGRHHLCPVKVQFAELMLKHTNLNQIVELL